MFLVPILCEAKATILIGAQREGCNLTKLTEASDKCSFRYLERAKRFEILIEV